MKKLFILPIILLLLSGFTVPPENIRINVDATRSTGKLEPFWASQIIHPTEFLLTEWGRNFISLLKESGAANDYIRIYNQPENAIRIGPDGKISYDWSRFDEMAELILSTGNKLKIVFFSMPFELAAFPESVRKRPYGAVVCTSPPKDYKQWEELCADFTRHVVNKYGIKEVRKWTFRCWNEPDLTGFWYKADLNAYNKLYDHFAKAVKEVNPEIKIGGPGLATSSLRKPENFRFFLDHITSGTNHATGKVGSPIDYIAVHAYGGIGGGPAPGREYPEVDYMIQQPVFWANIRDEYPQLKNVPIHVEEWGESASGTTGVSNNPMSDIRNSQHGAAFLTTWVTRHVHSMQENDRKIESFTFCASGYERIPKADFMGYRTLDTKHGFHKPILNAYKLLHRLAPELVSINIISSNNHISAFAARDSKKITIVVTNYQFDRINNDGPSYPVTLNINSHWTPGTKVELNHWRIDKNHSNAYTAFKELGSPELPNPLEIDAIKKRMDMEMLEMPKQITGKDLADVTFELPCNAVSLIEIVRY